MVTTVISDFQVSLAFFEGGKLSFLWRYDLHLKSIGPNILCVKYAS